MSSYLAALDYLYGKLPMFTRDGVSAFKKDLTNTLQLCEALGNPQQQIRTIHIAGTNGKGSTSHMLAAILQEAGYKTGLYTSPHLLDFRERIRVNGEVMPEQDVVDFVTKHRTLIDTVQPSFFEVTVAMAFDYFAKEQVDIAIIETGLGGRLDSTNVIQPILSVITNIGYDHMYLLGDTLPAIAAEKAGIIKPGVPVVITERQAEADLVFIQKAAEVQADIIFSADLYTVDLIQKDKDFQYIEIADTRHSKAVELKLDLRGSYQLKNVAGVLTAVDVLKCQGFLISDTHLSQALRQVQVLTGLQGRWQTLQTDPLVICDTGHNKDGWREVLSNIDSTPYVQLHIVIGVMQDKDLEKMLPLLPLHALYYFCQVDMPRALQANLLKDKAVGYNLKGNAYSTVSEAVSAAKQVAKTDDLIFVGGSTFVVADLLKEYLAS